MIKKLFLTSFLAMVLALAACGGDAEEPTDPGAPEDGGTEMDDGGVDGGTDDGMGDDTDTDTDTDDGL